MLTIQLCTIIFVILAITVIQLTLAGATYLHKLGKGDNSWDDHIDQMFDAAPNGMCLAHINGQNKKYNRSLCRMLGADHVIDPSTYDPVTCCPIYTAIEQFVQRANFNAPFEHKFPHADGSDVWCLMTGNKIYRSTGVEVLVNFTDITQRKKSEDTIYNLAYYDSLTGLPNRTYFAEHIPQRLEQAGNDHRKLALFVVDVDDFKRVNDNYGHPAGDEMLKVIATQLAGLIEHRCEHEDICRCFAARLGGDEFVLIVEEIETAQQAQSVADKIFASFVEPVTIEGQKMHVGLSIGIALYPYDGSNVSTLLKSADLALYAAKDKGKNMYHFHEIAMNTRLEEHMQYESALHYFIDTGDFDLHYQPIFQMGTGILCGAETLFRSNKRRYQDMHLERLIGVAEETGLIIPLGKQILRRACITWRKNMGKTNGVVSVNLSMRQLEDQSIVKDILDILYETGLEPEQLTIEITETAFMRSFHENIRKLNKLRDAGIHIAVDDFGKGYSSMSYIQQLPVSKLKIDMAFIRAMEEDTKSAEIVKVIIILARTLGLTSLAEGVETQSQYDKLTEFECDEVQGFFSGKPMPMKNFMDMVENKGKDDSDLG